MAHSETAAEQKLCVHCAMEQRSLFHINGFSCCNTLRLTELDGRLNVSVLDLYEFIGYGNPRGSWKYMCQTAFWRESSTMVELNGPPATPVLDCKLALQLIGALKHPQVLRFRLALAATLVDRIAADPAVLTGNAGETYLPPASAEEQEKLFRFCNNPSSVAVSPRCIHSIDCRAQTSDTYASLTQAAKKAATSAALIRMAEWHAQQQQAFRHYLSTANLPAAGQVSEARLSAALPALHTARSPA